MLNIILYLCICVDKTERKKIITNSLTYFANIVDPDQPEEVDLHCHAGYFLLHNLTSACIPLLKIASDGNWEKTTII